MAAYFQQPEDSMNGANFNYNGYSSSSNFNLSTSNTETHFQMNNQPIYMPGYFYQPEDRMNGASFNSNGYSSSQSVSVPASASMSRVNSGYSSGGPGMSQGRGPTSFGSSPNFFAPASSTMKGGDDGYGEPPFPEDQFAFPNGHDAVMWPQNQGIDEASLLGIPNTLTIPTPPVGMMFSGPEIPPDQVAAGFTVTAGPHFTDPKPVCQDLTLPVDVLEKEAIRLRELPDYHSSHCPRDMPWHIYLQGGEVVDRTLQSLAWLGRPLPGDDHRALERLFDPPELRWLGDRAKEGKTRRDNNHRPVSLDELTMQFREHFGWAHDFNLRTRINDALRNIQKKPTFYRVWKNHNLNPWVTRGRWQRVYLITYPESWTGSSIRHVYCFDPKQR